MDAASSPDPHLWRDEVQRGDESADEASNTPGSAGRAATRRITSAGLADIIDRQADAVAALDRALAVRLGEFDRAFATRRTHLEGQLAEAEGGLRETVDTAIAQLRRAASDERRLLQEAAAARLLEFERVGAEQRQRLTELASDASTSLAELARLGHQLQEIASALVEALEALAQGPE